MKKLLIVTGLMLLCGEFSFGQQLVLGDGPGLNTKSAILELNSEKQGFLLPRINDTATINSLNPPEGMLVYFKPLQAILLRQNGLWRPLAQVDNYIITLSGDMSTVGVGTATATINPKAVSFSKIQDINANTMLGRSATSGTVQEISMGQGLTFSGTTLKVDGLPNSALQHSTINVTAGTSGNDVNVSGAPVSLGGSMTINIPTASADARGLVSAGDWVAFNSKQAPLSSGNLTHAFRITSTNTTLQSNDYVLINTGGAVTWTLPAASSCPGRTYKLVNQGSANVTLSTAVRISSLSTTTDLPFLSGSCWEIISDGTQWRRIISSN